MQTFLSTMADIGAETWIMHGTLLGWWWNQKVRVADAPSETQALTRGTDITVGLRHRCPGF